MKKILIITYYYPPAGGAGVQRWLRLANELAKEHEITVICTNNGDYPNRDDSLLADISPQINVKRAFTPTFTKFFHLFTRKDEKIPFGSLDKGDNPSLAKHLFIWMRANLIIPDMRVIWLPFATLKALQCGTIKSYDYVISSGPPHSCHLAALIFKKAFNCPHAVDMRDPWTDYYLNTTANRSTLTTKLDKLLENLVMKNADKLISASGHWADTYITSDKLVLPNGYYKKDFANKKYQRSSQFRIKYIGKIIDMQLATKVLTQINEICQSMGENAQISLIGDDCAALTKHRHLPFVPHNTAINEMINAEILILLVNPYDGNKGWIPIKVIEYIAAATPIIAIGPADGDASMLIRQYKAGIILDYHETEKLNDIIKEKYASWQTNKYERDNGDIRTLSISYKAKLLTKFLFDPESPQEEI